MFDIIVLIFGLISMGVFGFTLVEGLDGKISLDTLYLISILSLIHIKCKYGTMLLMTSLTSYTMMMISVFYFMGEFA